jgi:hypothetical protein
MITIAANTLMFERIVSMVLWEPHPYTFKARAGGMWKTKMIKALLPPFHEENQKV